MQQQFDEKQYSTVGLTSETISLFKLIANERITEKEKNEIVKRFLKTNDTYLKAESLNSSINFNYNGGDSSTNWHKCNPINYAIKLGKIELAKKLMAYVFEGGRFSPAFKQNIFTKALCEACESRQTDIVEFLLTLREYDISAAVPKDGSNHSEMTPFSVAMCEESGDSNFSISKMLLFYGADPGKNTASTTTSFREAAEFLYKAKAAYNENKLWCMQEEFIKALQEAPSFIIDYLVTQVELANSQLTINFSDKRNYAYLVAFIACFQTWMYADTDHYHRFQDTVIAPLLAYSTEESEQKVVTPSSGDSAKDEEGKSKGKQKIEEGEDEEEGKQEMKVLAKNIPEFPLFINEKERHQFLSTPRLPALLTKEEDKSIYAPCLASVSPSLSAAPLDWLRNVPEIDDQMENIIKAFESNNLLQMYLLLGRIIKVNVDALMQILEEGVKCAIDQLRNPTGEDRDTSYVSLLTFIVAFQKWTYELKPESYNNLLQKVVLPLANGYIITKDCALPEDLRLFKNEEEKEKFFCEPTCPHLFKGATFEETMKNMRQETASEEEAPIKLPLEEKREAINAYIQSIFDKEQEFKRRGDKDAEIAARRLGVNLQQESENYFSLGWHSLRIDRRQQFEQSWNQYIIIAAEELHQYRGWGKFLRPLADITTYVMTAGTGYMAAATVKYAITGNFLLFSSTPTASQRLLERGVSIFESGEERREGPSLSGGSSKQG